MEIVIDIPESKIKDPSSIDLFYMVGAIKNGTPLLKGHGRLIDADALKKKWIFGKSEKEEIDNAPTIVEAEMESD